MNNLSTTTVNLAIEGMSCGHCVARVTKALAGIPGVRVGAVTVGHADLTVSDAAALDAATHALAEAGYPARAEQPVTLPAGRAGGCCGGGGKPSCCG